MTNWKETTLGEVVDIIIDHRGMTPKKMGGDWASVGYRAVSAKSIKTGQLVNEDQMNLLPENLYRKWMKEEVEYGDILLTSEAPLGEHIIWKSEEKLVLSQRIFGIRTEKEVFDPFFFNYFIDSKYYQHQLKSRESGSTVTGIKQSELLKTKILLPPLSEQKEIAGVLSSLDDKIELLREENKTLEATAQAIFKEWFVNFNFPGATDKMIDSELGEIPEEWRIGRLSDVADITIGRTPPRKESEWFSTDSNDVKWISIKDMGNCGVYTGDTAEYLTRDAVERFNIPVIPKNTAVVSFKMTVGRVSITVEEMLSNEAIAHIKLKKDGLTVEYIYLFLKNFNFSDLGSTSSIVNATNSTAIKNLSVLIPEKNIIDEFDSAVGSVFQKILTNSEQIQTLSTLRDTLLPKLMSGDLRIK